MLKVLRLSLFRWEHGRGHFNIFHAHFAPTVMVLFVLSRIKTFNVPPLGRLLFLPTEGRIILTVFS